VKDGYTFDYFFLESKFCVEVEKLAPVEFK
jgi:hypothetical protein